jgi:hypothetical protein
VSHVVQSLPDLLKSYRWVKDTVNELETQAIKTVRGGDYGVKLTVPLPFRAGWKQGKSAISAYLPYSAPYAHMESDHTTIFGGVQWNSGEDERVLAIPAEIAPFETYTFLCFDDANEPVPVRITPGGYLYAPVGGSLPFVLNCRYPSARDGG